jgi:quinol monooxygenase YgiN
VFALLLKITANDGMVDELTEFLRWDAEVAAASEPGTLRFDVFPVPGEPNAVYLYEAYRNEEAFDLHKAGEPFTRFVDYVVPNVIASMDFLLRKADAAASNAATT